MRYEFSKEYKLAKVVHIDRELARLPKYIIGKRGNTQVVRSYDASGKRCRTFSKNKEAFLIAERRRQLIVEKQRLFKELNLPLRSCPLNITVVPVNHCALRGVDWEKMESQANEYPIKSDLWHNGIHMRSRFEVMVAGELDRLGLLYKYEPALNMGNKIIYPDFVVYLPEFDMCFIIECQGMMDEVNYIMNASQRISQFIAQGFIPYHDFLILGGTANYVPDSNHISNAVISLINQIASVCVTMTATTLTRATPASTIHAPTTTTAVYT